MPKKGAKREARAPQEQPVRPGQILPASSSHDRPPGPQPSAADWAEQIPIEQWDVYQQAIEVLRRNHIRFMLGGGFGLSSYTHRWRNTKDVDLYIQSSDRQLAIDGLNAVGFADYYDTRPYDRGWIYRATRQGVIVDLIWAMANRRAELHASWLDRATTVSIRGDSLPVIAAEELLWCKLYIVQGDHSDWPDILNLLYAVGPSLDWEHVLEVLGPDWPLLKAMLTLFDWLSPEVASRLPGRLRHWLGLPQPAPASKAEELQRARHLDSRKWFIPMLQENEPLEI